MLSETLAMDESTPGSSTTRSSGGLIDSPGSCLSSGYCSDDTGSGGHDDVFFGRHGKDCWMSSADVDTVDLLRGSLPPFDAELSCTASVTAATAAVSCHDSVIDTTIKFDDVVDNWLFNSMSVPSPCVDDWPLRPPALSTSTSEELEDLPTDSVLADLLLNQSAYMAASTHLTRPEVETDISTQSAELGRKPPETVTTAGVCQTEVGSSMSATKRTLELETCESSATRRRRSSPCRACSRIPEVTSSSTSGNTAKMHRAAMCSDCSTDAERRQSTSVCTTSSTADVDLSRLSTLRPDWPGFADVVASDAVCPLQSSSDTNSASVCYDRSVIESPDVDRPATESAVVSSESSRTTTSRPVILEALLRSSSRLDANKGSSAALSDQLTVAEDASPTNQEPRLLHRLLRGELDEADIHRAAEQAAAAAAAAGDHQQQHLERGDAAPDAAECPGGWSRRVDNARMFADLTSYCNTAACEDDHVTTPADADIDAIIATIQVPVGNVGDDWLRRYLGDVFSCCSR